MKQNINYIRAHRFSRLFYRYIQGTPLESEGWTGERLAVELERLGYIKIVERTGMDNLGRWTKKEPHYIEVSGRHLTKKIFDELEKAHLFAR